ncbi:FAD-dependent monooxygenase [Bacillus sp. EB600]|uniref:FAD-dependent monooxygenase n=1 Tax=Bacillus sp. EB600 TaxID=2806345 RepID=UPI00210B41F8|nr:FAD-dependent monooxygenase [Bacillus sp. EB600]MCQ6282318.1 FAD-dependent monooxygenase [Bacillus sp. EB600]
MTYTNTENTVLIAGGGIGGLAAALAAAEAGQATTVFEKAPEFGEVGAGIQLAANGVAVLKRYGLMDRINDFAVYPKRLVLKDAWTGEELTALDLGKEYEERYGAPYIVLHRSDLHSVLLEACKVSPLVSLYTDTDIHSVEKTADGVYLTNQRGEKIKGKAVIGADGIHSNVRKHFVQDQPVNSAYVAYRGTLPIEVVSEDANMDDVIMWIGPNSHVVQYCVRRGELYNQVVVFKSPTWTPESTVWGTPEEMMQVFEGCHEKIGKALEFINKDFRWPMYDRNPIGNWTDDNITLLGDAAHPMLQYLAQGGVQALEDTAKLADVLKAHGENFEAAFKEYQEERLPRSARVQTTARFWGEIIHAVDPLAIALRNDIFKKCQANGFFYTDWLHGYKREAAVYQNKFVPFVDIEKHITKKELELAK